MWLWYRVSLEHLWNTMHQDQRVRHAANTASSSQTPLRDMPHRFSLIEGIGVSTEPTDIARFKYVYLAEAACGIEPLR